MNGLKASSIVNVYDVSGKHKQNKNQSSSKLWHYCLHHISKERIERLIIEEIVYPLDFLEFDWSI